ncbi:lysine transporter LysE [Sporosarcina sp. ANT_H38]|uniref:LysE family transporter n=1 Tax=Sporosarcina sp. ANT_H38 TaxID=2597358 RepID=UPI0011F35277|nr:LysE family transporter [Sporosarcina sp. ANT_H38]KAA0965967.1 lysine transporter LysE [Sporosarcina sp. ANT_H38]
MPVLSFLLYVFIMSFTPGPNNIMAMLFANQYGFKKTLRFCLGVGAGFFVIMIVSTYFNLMLHNFIPKIELPMMILGAGYMLYLAIKIITSTTSANDDESGKYNGFLSGMLLQFVNPKGVLFGITVVATYILPYHTSTSSLLLLALFLGFVGILSTCSWSLFGSMFQKFLSNYKKQFNIVMALLLVYSAVSLFV